MTILAYIIYMVSVHLTGCASHGFSLVSFHIDRILFLKTFQYNSLFRNVSEFEKTDLIMKKMIRTF